MSVLSVNGVGKAYRTYRSEWHRFARWFGLPLKPASETWVLRDISFDLEPGESIGIIGQNGAGKSTLLKIITGILQPTEGHVQANGRIAAILELGMGFNSELTGRQNVYHSAGIMGFSADQISGAMSDIESFAEIDSYFDEPLQTYSSGMQMRVAFAVATAFLPAILIVDEALSVGDIFFQQKCLERIKKMQTHGTSLILVSHNTHTVRTFTERALLINQRKSLLEDTNTAIEIYEQQQIKSSHSPASHKKINAQQAPIDSSTEQDPTQGEIRSGDVFVDDGTVKFVKVRLLNDAFEEKHSFSYGELLKFRISLQLRHKIKKLVLGVLIKDNLGRDIFCFNTHDYKGIALDSNESSIQMLFDIENRLVEGLYFISISLAEYNNHETSFHHRYFSHRISHFYSENKASLSKFMGVCDLRPNPCGNSERE